MRAALAALLVVFIAAPAAAGPREDALAALADRGDVEARRRAALTLADAGTMADAPALLAALRDPDARVRVLAERALWEVWSRSGTDEVDDLLRAGIVEMQHGQLEASIDTFSEVIRRRRTSPRAGTSAPPSITSSASTGSPPPTATRCSSATPRTSAR